MISQELNKINTSTSSQELSNMPELSPKPTLSKGGHLGTGGIIGADHQDWCAL